jgi:hypothetical protein
VRVRTLAACLLWTAVALLFAVGPELLAAHQVWSRAGEYELKEFVVASSECRGGERELVDSRWRTTPLRCWSEGTIDGRNELFETGDSLPGDHVPGARLEVWLDRETYETGLAGESVRIRRHDDRSGDDDLGRRMGRTFHGLCAVLALALLGVVLLDRFYRARLPGRGECLRESGCVLDMGGGIPFLGIPLVSLGAALLLEPLATWTPPGGRWLFAVGAVSLGAGMLARRTVRLLPDGTVVAGWAWLGFSTGASPVSAPAAGIRVLADGRSAAHEVQAAGRRLGVLADHAAATAAAERIAQALECPLEVDQPLPPRRRRFSLATDLAAVLVLAFGGALLVPDVREQAYLAILSPDGPPSPQLRRFAARQLAGHPTPESVETLVRLVNTAWGEAPELAADSVASLERIAGRGPVAPPVDPQDAAAWVNPWAAERLGRALDDNGGVLGWFPIAGSLVAGLEALASPEPEIAAASWSLYGAGVITSPGDLLLLSGAALADRRPISFALVPDPDGEGGAMSALSEPMADHGDRVLARTVGEAIALRYWLLLAGRHETLSARTDRQAAEDLARLGLGAFPSDFPAWWAEQARAHRLPP